MNKKELLQYYKKVAEAIAEFSQNREFVPVYYKNGEKRFGKRPDKVEYAEDVIFYVKKGATSFHVSLERWKDVDALANAKREKDLRELRIGWDLVFDIDSPEFEISKIIAKEICDFLEEKNIPYFVKYSGNKGFHIIIPWETFPKTLERNGKELEISKEFPKLARLVISYVYDRISKKLAKKLEKIVQEYLGISAEEFQKEMVVDTILISTRHLFRAPYSLNEKQWKASIWVENVSNFSPDFADPSLIEDPTNPNFAELEENGNVAKLFKAALLFEETEKWKRLEKVTQEFSIVVEEYPRRGRKRTKHPPCIRNILNGLKDGRKRAVFILINYFRRIGYGWDEIRRILFEWNEKNEEPLKERYIEYQIEWHMRKEAEGIKYLPPNCDNPSYYQDMGVCERDKDPLCQGIKNPLQYGRRPLKKKKEKDKGEEG